MTGPDEMENTPDGDGPDEKADASSTEDGGTKSASGASARKTARSPSESREDRLGAALRANLRRRKSQARGRKSSDDPA
ncbi:MAG: hypothetical protein RLN89_04265 [Parvibaculum sp.]